MSPNYAYQVWNSQEFLLPLVPLSPTFSGLDCLLFADTMHNTSDDSFATSMPNTSDDSLVLPFTDYGTAVVVIDDNSCYTLIPLGLYMGMVKVNRCYSCRRGYGNRHYLYQGD
ncbi:hypothetical protein Adt_26981 [Abeliophyllum distichum]|uniref:Uncharacterized protein n=1 Tax=Abeliophyllum distichum TaxID=126358 RepID=A0ABD1RSP8_9LAMI